MLRRRLLPVLVAVALASGCQLGERPYFSDDPFPPGALSGDPAIDAVLERLDAVTTGPVTAVYSVLRKYGAVEYTATVSLSNGQRAITLGNTKYLQTDTVSQTCAIDASRPCAFGIDDAAASDVGLTIDFYAADTARRLRRDATAKSGPTTARTETFAEQASTCVDVPLPGGIAVYCALDNGVLAKLDDGDVLVTLVTYATTVDLAVFVPAS
ncbi:MAG: hypothetical protein ACKOAZ_01045 [Ilumatobacteraceae bacterium]